jgi:hypothetical protein
MMMMLVMTALDTLHILPHPANVPGGVVETPEICD